MNFQKYLTEKQYLTEGEFIDLLKSTVAKINALPNKKEILKSLREYIKNNFASVMSMIKNFFGKMDMTKFGLTPDKLEQLKEDVLLEFIDEDSNAFRIGFTGIIVVIAAIFVFIIVGIKNKDVADHVKFKETNATVVNKIDRVVNQLRYDPQELFDILHKKAITSRFPHPPEETLTSSSFGHRHTHVDWPEDMQEKPKAKK